MPDLTFFVWADTHFGYGQRFDDDDPRASTIQQMNGLPGWPYPAAVGGTVDTPQFVVLCGDAVDSAAGRGESELAYFRYFTKRLRFPQIEVMGNHDVDPAYQAYFRGRYGGLSHSFDREGVHCICLNSQYDEHETGSFGDAELEFLRTDLDRVDGDTPVVLFVHSRLDRTTNGADVLPILGARNVALIVSAHIHKPAVFRLDGIDCVDVGQCRDHPIDPESGRVLYVFHITDTRLTGVPWRRDLQEWEQGRRWADPHAAAQRLILDRSR